MIKIYTPILYDRNIPDAHKINKETQEEEMYMFPCILGFKKDEQIWKVFGYGLIDVNYYDDIKMDDLFMYGAVIEDQCYNTSDGSHLKDLKYSLESYFEHKFEVRFREISNKYDKDDEDDRYAKGCKYFGTINQRSIRSVFYERMYVFD